jgi:hypothetical protein
MARKPAIDISDITSQCKPGMPVDLAPDGTNYSVAVFSEDRKYRFYLRRVWDRKLPRMAFIMLNPSTADAFKNDPTVARCQERATRLGFGSFSVTNIFAYRSTQPNALFLPNVIPIGDGNDEWIVFAAQTAAKIMVGWGNHGKHMNRSENVIAMLEDLGRELFCLGQNKGGCPVHPLYQAYEKPLRRYVHSVL